MDDLDALLTEPEHPDDSAEAEAEAAKEAEARSAFEENAPSLGSFLGEAIDHMRRRAAGAEKPIPIPHLPGVADALHGGLWPGMHVLVGNTGSGKSQFALQLSHEAAKAGAPVLYIGLELGKTGLAARMLGLASGRKWSRLFLGQNGDGEHDPSELADVAARHADALAALPWHLEVAGPYGWPYDRLAPRVASLVERYPDTPYPPLVVLDFAQLVSSPADGREESLRERIQKAAYAARAVARDHGAAVLLVSSTARNSYAQLWGEKGDDKKPPWKGDAFRLVGLGKESGEVEYAADSVLVLVSEGWAEGTAETSMHLAVAKLRIGPSQWVSGLRFDGGRFKESKAAEDAAADGTASGTRGWPQKRKKAKTPDLPIS